MWEDEGEMRWELQICYQKTQVDPVGRACRHVEPCGDWHTSDTRTVCACVCVSVCVSVCVCVCVSGGGQTGLIN